MVRSGTQKGCFWALSLHTVVEWVWFGSARYGVARFGGLRFGTRLGLRVRQVSSPVGLCPVGSSSSDSVRFGHGQARFGQEWHGEARPGWHRCASVPGEGS